MTAALTIRKARRDEFDELGRVLFDAVRTGESPYTAEQRAAWAPEPRGGSEWHARLAAQQVFVAEAAGTLVGFMSLAGEGHVDLAFLLPAWRGRGLFRRYVMRKGLSGATFPKD